MIHSVGFYLSLELDALEPALVDFNLLCIVSSRVDPRIVKSLD